MTRLEHPTLYGPTSTLFASRCAGCGRVSFPRQEFGCEACGAFGESLTPVELEARGELLSFAIVRKHMGHDIETPFVMCEIRLEAGPIIRATLADGLAVANLAEGQKVAGVLAHNPKQSADVLELRFALEGR